MEMPDTRGEEGGPDARGEARTGLPDVGGSLLFGGARVLLSDATGGLGGRLDHSSASLRYPRDSRASDLVPQQAIQAPCAATGKREIEENEAV